MSRQAQTEYWRRVRAEKNDMKECLNESKCEASEGPQTKKQKISAQDKRKMTVDVCLRKNYDKNGLCYSQKQIIEMVQASGESLRHLNLLSVKLPPEIMKQICEAAPNIESLALRECTELTEETAGVIATDLHKLRGLLFTWTRNPGGNGLKMILQANPGIEWLGIMNFPVSDATFATIAENCPGIKVIHSGAFTDTALQSLASKCHSLERLHNRSVMSTENLSNVGIGAIQKANPGIVLENFPNEVLSGTEVWENLKTISFQGKDMKNFEETIMKCTALEELDLGMQNVDDEILKILAKSPCANNLKKLEILGPADVSDEGFMQLKNFPSLEYLDVGYLLGEWMTRLIKDETVIEVSKFLPNLTTLNVAFSLLTVESLNEICDNCPNMKLLVLDGCGGEDEDYTTFRMDLFHKFHHNVKWKHKTKF